MGNFFFCFDGCAQYMTSPTAPYLIASAYRCTYRNNERKLACPKSGDKKMSHQKNYKNSMMECESPPILVACVRDPVEQAISWWKYENNAMSWGESMGLTEWNTDLRSTNYPPKSIGEAFKYSMSDLIEKAYTDAEKLVEASIPLNYSACEEVISKRIKSADNIDRKGYTHYSIPAPLLKLLNFFNGTVQFLPPWAITWPGGQLSTIGRSCRYASNVRRFNRVFLLAFGGDGQLSGSFGNTVQSKSIRRTGTKNLIGFVHIIPLESQCDCTLLKSVIRPFLSDIVQRSARRRKQPYFKLMTHMDRAINRLCMSSHFNKAHRNLGVMLTNADMEPNKTDLNLLTLNFEKETKKLKKMLGRKLS